ncbi:MAG: hypothetical protein ACRCXN_09275, partial [Bacteroidales bacterium]
MNRLFSLSLFAFIVLFFQCKSEQNEIAKETLITDKSIDAVADTIFFKEIVCLQYHDDNIYFSNPVTDQIFCLSKDLDYKSTIGKRGQGPGHLLGIDQFAFSDSVMSVLNYGNIAINLYVNGKEVGEKKFAPAFIIDRGPRYVFEDSCVIASSQKAETPLIKYNIYTEEAVLFGEPYRFSSEIKTFVRKSRFVANSKDAYLVVSDNQPFIECYDKKTLSLTDKYDYSSIPEVASSLDVINSKTDLADNSFYTICRDIYATDKYLYVLMADYTNDNYCVDKILKFAIHPDIKAVALIKLPEGHYESICVSADDSVVYAS